MAKTWNLTKYTLSHVRDGVQCELKSDIDPNGNMPLNISPGDIVVTDDSNLFVNLRMVGVIPRGVKLELIDIV